MLGMAIRVMGPGEPSTTYHWETEQEDFLVLAGEGLLIVEGQERPLRRWDFVHCPPETRHAFVGTGDGPFVLLCASSRQFQKDGPWGYYSVDETAARHNASSPEETQDGDVAYARFAPGRKDALPGRAAAGRVGKTRPAGQPTAPKRRSPSPGDASCARRAAAAVATSAAYVFLAS